MTTTTSSNSTATDIAIHCAGLVKIFTEKGPPVHALHDVDVSVSHGEIAGLVGPDGAGKTTLIRCIAGLLEATSGDISVLDLDPVADALVVRGRIGYMPQKFGLYQDLTVQENLDLFADLQSVPIRERRKRFDRLLQMTDLSMFTGRLSGRLSGGMKQKLGLACALVKSPEVLLLDEPTVGVDPVSRRELWKIVGELVEQDNIAVLVSTAYLDETDYCDRVLVMFDGEITDRGAPDVFRAQLVGQVDDIHCADQRQARQIQSRAVSIPHVADATIRSGRVRIVHDDASDAGRQHLRETLGAELDPADPVFEDAFMRLAYKRRHAQSPNRASCPPDEIPDGADGAALSTLADDTHSIERPNEPVVRVRNLVKRFGEFEAVKGVSFDVQAGEVFGLLGPNGAGKSTTFRMLCGLLKVSEGEVLVAGHDLRRAASQARARLGYMAQQFSLYGHLSVFDNLSFFGQAYGLSGKRFRTRLDWAYDRFGLRDRRNTPAGALPGGYKQRLAMAAAMLHEPDILFLDEPTSGVDPLARREFWQRINAFAEAGVTVIVTTHFMEEAEYCDRMLIMVQGEPLALGTPGDIRDLARDEGHPDPSIEDAFIALAEGRVHPEGAGVHVGEPS